MVLTCHLVITDYTYAGLAKQLPYGLNDDHKSCSEVGRMTTSVPYERKLVGMILGKRLTTYSASVFPST